MEDYEFVDHLRVLMNVKKKLFSLTESLKPKEYILSKDAHGGQLSLFIDFGDHVKKYLFSDPRSITSANVVDSTGNTSNDRVYAPTLKTAVKKRKLKKKKFQEMEFDSSVKILDRGICYVMEDNAKFKDFDFQGDSMQGRYIMRNIEFKDGSNGWIWWKPVKQSA